MNRPDINDIDTEHRKFKERDKTYSWYSNDFYAKTPYWEDGLWVHNLVEYYNGKPEQEIHLYKYSTKRFPLLSLKERIQCIWKILRTGKVFDDNQLTLEGKEARKLAQYILKETDERVIKTKIKK